MSFSVILKDSRDISSSDFKYWSGQSSSSTKGYQTVDPHQPTKTGPKRKLTRYEFFFTLVRIRLALTAFLLGDIFGVSTSMVTQIFTTWINYMAVMLTPLLKWPSKNVINRFRPGSFRLIFPNVTVIIDCADFFSIKKPRNPTAQSQTFSSYKQHNTFKTLVFISPSGAITYISKLWGDNVSDRFITKDCGFFDLIQPGDEIMADRGFLLRDFLLKKRAKLMIPPFTKRYAQGKGNTCQHLTSSRQGILLVSVFM